MKKNTTASSPWEFNRGEKAGESDLNRIIKVEREETKLIL